MGVRNAAGWIVLAAAASTPVWAAQDQPVPQPPSGSAAGAATQAPGATQETTGEAAVAQQPQAPPSRWSIELRGGTQIDFRTDVDDTPGDVEIVRAGVGVNIGYLLGQRSRITLDVSEEVSWYLFENATGLSPGSSDPFENVYRTNIRPMFSTQHDMQWSWFVGGILEFAGEPDADIGDAATFGAFGGARYAVSETFAFSFGLGAKSRLEDGALVLPVFGVEWKVNDRVSFSADNDSGVRVTAKMTDTLTASIMGNWELREYRLADDASIPDGVVRDSCLPIGLELGWRPRPGTTITLTGGAIVWRELTFDDSTGDRVTQTNTDPTPYLGLKVRFDF